MDLVIQHAEEPELSEGGVCNEGETAKNGIERNA